jgi:hypothetical protein
MAGTACVAMLLFAACGYGPGREKEYSEGKQAADHADLARPLEPNRAVGSDAAVTGCLLKESDQFILTRNDAGVDIPASGGKPPGPDSLGNSANPKVGRAAYRLKSDRALDGFVGKEITVTGTLSAAANIDGSKDSDLAQITVANTAIVNSSCAP